MTRSLRRTSASRRRRLTGLLFVSPWIVGGLAFFLVPMGQSVFYMFNDVTVEPGGMKSVYVGGEILQDVLLDDPQNVRMMLTSIAQTLVDLGILGNAALADKAVPNCNVVCIRFEEMKDDLSGYLKTLHDAEASSIGSALPDDGFYYIGS